MAMAMAEDCCVRRQRCRLQLGVVGVLIVVLVLTPESLESEVYLLTDPYRPE
jgi:hypothetical protein